MKKIIVSLAILLAGQVSAQYFTRSYGSTTDTEYNSQFDEGPNGVGYFVAGWYQPGNGAQSEIHVITTNVNGVPIVNERIALKLPSNVNNKALATSVVRIGATNDYIVAGRVITTEPYPNEDIFLLRINGSTGVIVWKFRYSADNLVFSDPKIKMDLSYTNILVTGSCRDIGSNDPGDIYVLNVSQYGSLNWSMLYNFPPSLDPSIGDYGQDIIHNPYSAGNLIVVGRSSGQALLMSIDNSNGNPISAKRYTLPGNTNQEFVCINRAYNTAYGNDCFIVGGNVLQNGSSSGDIDSWALMMNQNGNILWSTTFDNNVQPLKENKLSEIMERHNTFNAFEYYTAGTLRKTVDLDAQVVKLNSAGIPVPSGEFIYGESGVGKHESAYDIHQANGSNGGFVISGNTYQNLGDQRLLKAFYNGVSTCYTLANNASYSTPLPYFQELLPQFSIPLIVPYDQTSTINTLGYSTICDGNPSGGNNNRSAVATGISENTINDLNLSVYPNPANTTISIKSSKEASIGMYNVLGEKVKTFKVMGENTESFDISSLPAGIYMLKSGDSQQSIKIIKN